VQASPRLPVSLYRRRIAKRHGTVQKTTTNGDHVMALEFKPGDIVQTSGIYAVKHDNNHAAPHDVTCVKGEHFPPCNHCGSHPRFVLRHEAVHVNQHPHFQQGIAGGYSRILTR